MAAFTTIAAISSAALSTGMSFAEASKQRKLQQEAEAEAQKAFDEAKKTLDVNYLESLGIAKEPYELERESLLQAGAQALQAGVEGEARGAAATAGRVLMAQQEQAAQQRAAMSREMQQLQQLAAQEESRLQGARADLMLGEAVGQQQRAQQAQEMRQAALGQAVGGLFDIAGTAIGARDLYAGSPEAKTAREMRQFQRQQDPSKLTRSLGLSNIQTVAPVVTPEYAPGIGLTGRPGLFAPIFKTD